MSTYINAGRGISFQISEIEAPDFLKEYLRYLLVVENLSQQSVRTYYIQLRSFLRWAAMKDRGDYLSVDKFVEEPIVHLPFSIVANLEAVDIYEFLTYSQTVLGNGASTRKLKLSALKSFYEYNVKIAQRIDRYPTSAISPPRMGKRIPKFLNQDECLKLLDSIGGKNPERDYCIITFLINCGMRLSELVGINLGDIKDGSIRLRGKGRKERMIYLNASCLYALEEWLTARSLIEGSAKIDALFISTRSGQRITGRWVEKIVHRALVVSGLSNLGYTTHTLRHTAATLMYQSGSADILTLQAILGHESIETTRIYTHLDESQVRNAMRSSPLSGQRPRQKPDSE